jgi:hypothetical protein
VAVIPAEFGDVAARRALKSDLSRYLHKLVLETGKLLTCLELDFYKDVVSVQHGTCMRGSACIICTMSRAP